MDKTKIITFSAPVRYAEVLEKVSNRSALMVEALGQYFAQKNYGLIKQAAPKKSKKTISKVKNQQLLQNILAFRSTLTTKQKSITIAEIIKYKNEGRQ